MRAPIFQVDAFTHEVFKGNPAAVVPLEAWLPDPVLQAVAAENNLAETAYCVREGAHHRLRWFTPRVEVDLCGHATLATAHVLLTEFGHEGPAVFETRSGRLVVRSEVGGDRLVMDFPAFEARPCSAPAGLADAIGADPSEVRAAWAYMVVLADEAAVAGLTLDMPAIERFDRLGILVTAPGTEVDFVSRCFFPGAGIPEDPVTGSAHCIMAPYWAERLGKAELVARQISPRGGEVGCKVANGRVELAGHARTYLRGEIEVPSRP